MSLSVFFRTSFVAFHRWSDAPDDHAYLREIHRHVFYVEGSLAVSHANRDVEFIALKRLADQRIAAKLRDEKETLEWSCEHWAKWIGGILQLDSVEVSEDGENGARWTR